MELNTNAPEATKFVTGKFLNSGQMSCIIVNCNCSDMDFNGRYCKKFDTENELPNAVQIFELKN